MSIILFVDIIDEIYQFTSNIYLFFYKTKDKQVETSISCV